jgi:hypothetical protein
MQDQEAAVGLLGYMEQAKLVLEIFAAAIQTRKAANLDLDILAAAARAG